MLDLKKVTESLRDCPCGRKHEINIRSLEIGYKNTGDTGRILREAEFGKKLHVVADKNTLKAAEGCPVGGKHDFVFACARGVRRNKKSVGGQVFMEIENVNKPAL